MRVTRRGAICLPIAAVSCCLLDGHFSLAVSQTPRCSARFKGDVVAKWLKDGRNMSLVEPLEFVSSDCRRWVAPKGAVTDGASIPQFFWTVLGGPYEDKYREAAVIHDYYCTIRTRKCTSVHSVFYQAMLVSGVNERRAWLFYEAVSRFGPKWPDPPIDDPRCDVIDDNYDFASCSLNSSNLPIEWPIFNKPLAAAFIESLEGRANMDDILRLKDALSNL
jgi:hypothetical protein